MSGTPAAEEAVQEVECTLKELYDGCQKTIGLSLSSDGVKKSEKEFIIDVKPGWKHGTRVRFKQTPQFPIAVTFVIKLRPHKYFEVEGSDLVWHCALTSRQRGRGVNLRIPLLSGEEHVMDTTSLHLDRDRDRGRGGTREVVVKGAGMPLPSPKPGSRLRYGNLVVKFHFEK